MLSERKDTGKIALVKILIKMMTSSNVKYKDYLEALIVRKNFIPFLVMSVYCMTFLATTNSEILSVNCQKLHCAV